MLRNVLIILAFSTMFVSSRAHSEQYVGVHCDLLFLKGGVTKVLCETGLVALSKAQSPLSGEVITEYLNGTYVSELVQEVTDSAAHRNLWRRFEVGISQCEKDSLCLNSWGFSYLDTAFRNCRNERRPASLSNLFVVFDEFLQGFIVGNVIGCETRESKIFVIDYTRLPAFGLSVDDEAYRETFDTIRVILFEGIEGS